MKFFQLNGTSDYLKTASIIFDEIIIDMKARPTPTTEYYFDARTGAANTYLYRNTSNIDFYSGSSFFNNGHYWNGVLFLNNATSIPSDTRGILRLVANTSQLTDDIVFFANNTGATSTCMAADVYSIKTLLDGVVQAFWDFTTGTVTDQTGNGNVLTLVGGTWLDDGTGAPTGTAISATFATKQSISLGQSQAFATKQSISHASLVTFQTKQIISKEITTFFDTEQVITKTGTMVSTSFQTKQTISLVQSVSFDTYQTYIGDYYKEIELSTYYHQDLKINGISTTILEITSYIAKSTFEPIPSVAQTEIFMTEGKE